MKSIAWRAAAVCFVLAAAGAWSTAQAQVTWNQVLNWKAPTATPAYAAQRIAKGGPDECFNGIGVDYPAMNPDGTCTAGVPKANLAYVWGLVQAGLGDPSFTGDEIWFGTVANPLCAGGATGLLSDQPYVNVSWVCEFGSSELSRRPNYPLPPALGDWREPRAYSYNLTTGKLTDRTPPDSNFLRLQGLRSAASLGNAVILAGPNFADQVTFAAWDASTGTYKGSCQATALDQIRQWITVNGVLYAGAGTGKGDGVILRWAGTPDNPFNSAAPVSDYCGFQVVGNLPAFPAYLANYDNKRIAVSAWNKATNSDEPITAKAAPAAAANPSYSAGVYIGPAFDASGGYTTANASDKWTRIWATVQYEKDPVVADTVGVGAIAFWKGWLWFGTMANNESSALIHSACTFPKCYGPPSSPQDAINLLFNVSRAASFWRAQIAPGGNTVQMLYGQTELPVLVPNTKTFQMVSTGWTPLYGQAGFNNPFATYTWSASAGTDDLLIGMYDYRYVQDVRLGLVQGTPGQGVSVDPTRGYGGDLWRFTDPNLPPTTENVNGLNNWTNYGFRNILRIDGGPNLLVGTASGLNLEPGSGWELQYLSPLGAPAKAVKH